MSTVTLNSHEARALGVLIEKELTTPDQYPLSLNALVSGCNQKSNRDPVVDFTQAEVVVTMQGLVAKHLAGRASSGRVEKFRHNARERFQIPVPESAVLAELLVRGPQQPGELRTRVKRMAPVESVDELIAILQRLATLGLVKNQGRSPGERAERWGQLLCPTTSAALEANPTASSTAPAPAAAASPSRPNQTPVPAAAPETRAALEQRVADLESRVARLESVLADLGG